MQRLNDNDAGEALHKGHRGAQPSKQKQVHNAASTQNQLHRDGPDERRNDQGEYAQVPHQSPSGEVIPNRKDGQGQRYQAAEQNGQDAGQQAVPQGLPEQIALEEVEQVVERELASSSGRDLSLVAEEG